MNAQTATSAATSSSISTVARRIAGTVLTLIAAVGIAIGIPTAADAATLGGVQVFSVASYDCGAQEVDVQPVSMEEVGSDYSVWAEASVYNYATNQWVSDQYWSLVDGITTHPFREMTNFYGSAYVTYAKQINGAWSYQSEWVQIEMPLDMGFCTR